MTKEGWEKMVFQHVECGIRQNGGENGYMQQGDKENEVTLLELRQFPGLKKATVMSSNFNKAKEVSDAANVEVELL